MWSRDRSLLGAFLTSRPHPGRIATSPLHARTMTSQVTPLPPRRPTSLRAVSCAPHPSSCHQTRRRFEGQDVLGHQGHRRSLANQGAPATRPTPAESVSSRWNPGTRRELESRDPPNRGHAETTGPPPRGRWAEGAGGCPQTHQRRPQGLRWGPYGRRGAPCWGGLPTFPPGTDSL